jgi:predicted dehydrogenase
MALRGAISGFGEVAAQAHLAGWRARPDVTIVAVHDPVSARRHQAINLVRNVRVYDDLELMLTGEALDFVDIASPPAFHANTVRLALEANINVLVEKPLCLEPAEFAELAGLAARKRRVLMCVHNWKHSPAYRRAHELVMAGRLGALRYVSLVRLRQGPAGGGGIAGAGGERWRLDARTGGGILIDHGWHVLYLAQWLMGGVAPVSVSARLQLRPGTNVDEIADLRLEFPGMALAYSHMSWRAPVRRTSAVIYGEDAILEIKGDDLFLTGRSGGVEDHSVSDSADDSYHASWFSGVASDFETALQAGVGSGLIRDNQAEAKMAVEVISAARRSNESGGSAVAIRL